MASWVPSRSVAERGRYDRICWAFLEPDGGDAGYKVISVNREPRGAYGVSICSQEVGKGLAMVGVKRATLGTRSRSGELRCCEPAGLRSGQSFGRKSQELHPSCVKRIWL
jgi:hypothetical protein